MVLFFMNNFGLAIEPTSPVLVVGEIKMAGRSPDAHCGSAGIPVR